jgi:hypothetical protein
MLSEPMFALEIPHQTPPMAYGPFADYDELFKFLLSSNRADDVTWYRIDTEEDFDDMPEETIAMLKNGPVVWAGIRDGMEFYPLADAPDHLSLLCEAVFGDSHWYMVGEHKRLIRALPDHQRHAARRELDKIAL